MPHGRRDPGWLPGSSTSLQPVSYHPSSFSPPVYDSVLMPTRHEDRRANQVEWTCAERCFHTFGRVGLAAVPAADLGVMRHFA